MKGGIHYDQTYAPVVSWDSVQLMLALAAIHEWKNNAKRSCTSVSTRTRRAGQIYGEILKGFDLAGMNRKEYILKIH